ncbi:MAG: hypothetical protein R6V41_00215 [Desulfobacteraceae bacterium]
MDFKAHLQTTWNLFISRIVPLLILTLVFFAASVITLGILAPVASAGYFHSILRLVREGRDPQPQDVFSHLRLFLPLLGFGIVVFIFILIGTLLLILPGILFFLAVSFFCLYMLPMMTDKELGLFDAIKQSFTVTANRAAEHLVVFLIFAGISALGGSFFIGALLTQPLATIFLMTIYHKEVDTHTIIRP